ncbi:MAG: hypothetical protein NVSMB23_29130 [Myxococcales bacterium]
MPSLAIAHLLFASTFLNGVNIDGVRPLTLEKCKTVRVDERGDVRMDCPAYQVNVAGSAARVAAATATAARPVSATIPVAAAAAVAAPAPANLTKQYWLVSEQAGGDAQVDVDLFVNAKWVRKLKSSEDQIVMDISRLLQPGPNKLLFAAAPRRAGEGKRGAPPGASLRIIVGEGEAGGGNIVIDNPLVDYTRSAAQAESLDEEFVVKAR